MTRAPITRVDYIAWCLITSLVLLNIEIYCAGQRMDCIEQAVRRHCHNGP